MKAYRQLIRLPHAVKNLLIFAPLLFSGQLLQKTLFFQALAAFAIMCLICSGVYILNDLRDLESDRLHPEKRYRPVASGTVSPKSAAVFAGILLISGTIWNIFQFSPDVSLLPSLYLLLNLGYSFGLKNIPLLDISILSAGFLIRLLYGAAVTGVAVSQWLFLTVLALSVYFALGKRRKESIRTRKVLVQYPPAFLSGSMNLCLTLALVSYALWSRDCGMVCTVPLVLLIVLKYSLTLESGTTGDPVEILWGDRVLFFLCASYGFLIFALLYL